MEVILLSDVYKHGVAGEVVSVADGFARNYLIPRKLAVTASPTELKKAAKLREQSAARRMAYENKLNELAREIDGVELIFGRRAANTGKLFGSVTTMEIADALMEATGVDINRRRISQQGLREIGTHEVPVRLGTEESPVLKVTIVREDELAEFLAARERGEEVTAEEFDPNAPEFTDFDPADYGVVEAAPEEAAEEAEPVAEPEPEPEVVMEKPTEASIGSQMKAVQDRVERTAQSLDDAVSEAAETISNVTLDTVGDAIEAGMDRYAAVTKAIMGGKDEEEEGENGESAENGESGESGENGDADEEDDNRTE